MKTMTRDEVIDDLRKKLLETAGDEHSICHVAKEKGLFCHGFAQWKLYELKAQYPQITRSRRRLTRERMEDLADRWQVARQTATGKPLACDVQMGEGRFQTCKGWDAFDDAELARFHAEICGEEVEIESDPAPRHSPGSGSCCG